MKTTKTLSLALILMFGSLISACNLSGELEEIKVMEMSDLENTGVTEGGSGGENLPPP